MSEYLQPWLSVGEQIDRLSKHGIEIEDRSRAASAVAGASAGVASVINTSCTSITRWHTRSRIRQPTHPEDRSKSLAESAWTFVDSAFQASENNRASELGAAFIFCG